MPDRKHPYLLWAYRRTQFFNRSPPSETAETPWGTSVVSLGGSPLHPSLSTRSIAEGARVEPNKTAALCASKLLTPAKGR